MSVPASGDLNRTLGIAALATGSVEAVRTWAAGDNNSEVRVEACLSLKINPTPSIVQ
jgi:hypothetical protein